MADSTQPSVPNTKNRPLSPHLQIYKWQITMTLSILHRATGVALVAGLVLLTIWVWSAAYCQHTFAWLQEHRDNCWILLILIGFTASLFFHLLNGIRHLGWDAGSGFDIPSATRSGWIVVVGTVLLTALVWCPTLNPNSPLAHHGEEAAAVDAPAEEPATEAPAKDETAAKSNAGKGE